MSTKRYSRVRSARARESEWGWEEGERLCGAYLSVSRRLARSLKLWARGVGRDAVATSSLGIVHVGSWGRMFVRVVNVLGLVCRVLPIPRPIAVARFRIGVRLLPGVIARWRHRTRRQGDLVVHRSP